MIVFSGTINVEGTQAHDSTVLPFLEIHDLNLNDPLSCGIIVVLNDGTGKRDVFVQDLLVAISAR